MAVLGVTEGDLQETFIHASGPGGQHVNKVATAVHLLHRPTGIAVKCEQTRSQAMNRFWHAGSFLPTLNLLKEERKEDGKWPRKTTFGGRNTAGHGGRNTKGRESRCTLPLPE